MRGSLSVEEKNILCERCASNLKVMRVYLGWKQKELADIVGTSHRRISEIENGKTKLTWTLFLALYTVFTLNPIARHSPLYINILGGDIVGYLSEGGHDFEILQAKLEESERESKYKGR